MNHNWVSDFIITPVKSDDKEFKEHVKLVPCKGILRAFLN